MNQFEASVLVKMSVKKDLSQTYPDQFEHPVKFVSDSSVSGPITIRKSRRQLTLDVLHNQHGLDQDNHRCQLDDQHSETSMDKVHFQMSPHC